MMTVNFRRIAELEIQKSGASGNFGDLVTDI